MAEDDGALVLTSPSCQRSRLRVVRGMVDAANVRGEVDGGAASEDASDPREVDGGAASEDASDPRSQKKVSPGRFFISGPNCRFRGGCRFLHSWWNGAEDFSLAMSLQGHRKPITGIALVSDSKRLMSSCLDMVKIWDCESGQCLEIVTPNLGRKMKLGCLIGRDPWIFLGIPGSVTAWNSKTGEEWTLDTIGGRQVYALVTGIVNGQELLFAGLSNGSIFVWRYNSTNKTFERARAVPSAPLFLAHRAIRVLVVWKGLLYSGSMDHTIKVWDLTTLECSETLTDHKDAVTSIIFWGDYMLSGSLDGTVRVWFRNVNLHQLQVIYTHEEAGRVITLNGMCDSRSNPVLMCSSDDFGIHFYDLPSFVERARIYSEDEIRHIVIGQDGLFCTGNASGDLKVWKWNTDSGS